MLEELKAEFLCQSDNLSPEFLWHIVSILLVFIARVAYFLYGYLSFPSTLQSLYNATHYNTVSVITRPGHGPQMVIFL